ncbi:MAG: protein kinase [Muribaculaceae bacterium]|nr:protein kinase [Muribaculaceae bacterium]
MKLFYEKYIKLAHIGKGANAHVYKVRHTELGYVRAIKVLNDYIEDKSERIYRSFLKECRTLLTIGNGCHPNIVRIYGPDLIDNHAIVEMDYIQGITFDAYIKQKGFLEYEEVNNFIHDIVGALAYTHHDIYKFLMDPEEDDLVPDPEDGRKYLISKFREKELVKKYGISHNDLHSNNVMRRDYDGRFILLDFGLAVQDGECVKSSRKSDGSPEYKAPEKFDSGAITPRCDVYSLGILMYEALTGTPPFVLDVGIDGKVAYPSLDKICREHHTATPPSILPLRKAAFEKVKPGQIYKRDYPEWLDKIIMKCLAKNPMNRYVNARELLDDIEDNASKETVSFRDSSFLEDENERLSIELNKKKNENADLRKKIALANFSVSQLDKVKNDLSLMTNRWMAEKHEKEKLRTALISAHKDTRKPDKRKWQIIAALLFASFIICLIWGYCMFLDFKASELRYADFTKQAIDSGLYDPQNGEWITINDDTIVKFRTDTIIKTVEVPIEKVTTQKVTDTVTKVKVEYLTPPEVQREVNRLTSENQKLRGQVQNLLKEISN